MNTYLLLFAIIFHAGLLTCQSPAPDTHKPEKTDTTAIVIEEVSNDFYDNMPNALQGTVILSIPNDFIPIDADVQPQFPGGPLALQEYIDKYLKIPSAVDKLQINGKVYTSFIITETGEIEEAAVVKSLQLNCDQAALELIHYMPKWKPAIKDGKAVRIRHYLEIPFDYKKQ